jgi:GT2 family glycosyltransferase
MTNDRRPEVTVVIPAYRSEATIARCLAALRRQSFTAFETVVVDSSPDDAVERAVCDFPEVRYERSRGRLLPQAARNAGAALGRGELLVFTDPDVYPAPGWLARLVEAHRATGGVVVGALACHGRRWLDLGIHLCKFSKWLPGGPPRPVDMGPSANLLCPRRLFAAAGGFTGDMLMGDTTLSWQLRRDGQVLWFEPAAVVDHHHLDRLGDFLSERFRRGRRFARLRMEWLGGRLAPRLLYLAASTLQVRLVSNLAHAARHAWRAGELPAYLLTFPIVALGFAASLAGEALSYASRGRPATAPAAEVTLPPAAPPLARSG